MMLPWSWLSFTSITLPQSTNTAATAKPLMSVSLLSVPISLVAHSPSPNFLFPSNHRSCARALICSATSSSSAELNESPSAKIFIKGLSRSTTEGQLRKAFLEFGEVTQVQIVRDKESERSQGYGFIWFSSKESAHLAVREMNGKFFDGRFILVTDAISGLPQRRVATMPYRF